MMKIKVLKIVSILAAGVTFSLQARTGAVISRSNGNISGYYPIDRSAECVPGRILIRIKNTEGLSKSAQSFQTTLQKFGGIEAHPLIKACQNKQTILSSILDVSLTPGTDPADAAERASRQSDILWAEPVYVRRPLYTPNDTYYEQQWYLQKIQMEPAWDLFRVAHPDGGEAILIGIVDTGVSLSYPDFHDRIWSNPGEVASNGLDDDGNGYVDDVNGWDFGDDDNNPNPSTTVSDGWHGTAVAAVAAAVTDNGVGIASPLFNVQILPVKTSEDKDSEQLIVSGYSGIVYAVDQGVKIINLSFGGAGASNAEKAILDYAFDHDVVVVAAAGNDNEDTPFYPANYPGVLSIAATDENDQKADFSNWGVNIALSAPGVSMFLPWKGNDKYDFIKGTSFSSPLVAGVAGLVMQNNPDWTGVQVREQIRISAHPIDDLNPDYARLLGAGRLNAYRALTVSSPSLRISDIQLVEIEGNSNGIPEAGETLALTLTVTNYLSPFMGGTVRITVKDANPDVFIQTGEIILPAIDTGSQWQNTENPVLIQISEDAGRGDVVYFEVKLSDGADYQDYDWIKLNIAPPFVTVAATNAKLSVTSTGQLGFVDYPENLLGDGFVFGEAGNLLFEGAFMTGTGPSAISDVARGTDTEIQDTDFSPLPDGDVMLSIPGQYGSEEAHAAFSDSASANPLNIHVVQRTFAFSNPGEENFILISYELRNLAAKTISNFYAGLFMDWDVGDPINNLGGFDHASNMGYIYEPRTYIYGGLAMVSTGGARGYALVNNPDEIYDGYSKSEKWTHLSGGIRNTTPRTASDYSQVLSAGPLTLVPDSTVRIGFAVVGGDGLSALKQNAQVAQNRWDSLFPNEPYPYPMYDFVLKANFPNPFNQTTVIQYSLSEWTHVSLIVYDLTGREVTRLVDEDQQAGPHEASWDGISSSGSVVSSGVYVYRLSAGYRAKSGKMVLIR